MCTTGKKNNPEELNNGVQMLQIYEALPTGWYLTYCFYHLFALCVFNKITMHAILEEQPRIPPPKPNNF